MKDSKIFDFWSIMHGTLLNVSGGVRLCSHSAEFRAQAFFTLYKLQLSVHNNPKPIQLTNPVNS